MSGGLFDDDEPDAPDAAGVGTPLAERMRPRTLDELVGHTEVLGPGSLLRRLIEEDRLGSLILWGPPGSGKTSLARLLAQTSGAHFEPLSAVLSGVKEVRQVVARARDRRLGGKRTLLFVDEIHRFNRAQQDAFLPHVEDGTILLVGATTENPSFQVNAPLLSRCRLIALERLGPDALGQLVDRALADVERGLGTRRLTVDEDARDALVGYAGGDARVLLGTLETAADAVEDGATLDQELVTRAAGERRLAYDRAGDAHYQLASALQKSIRSGDVQAGLYWCVRMIEAGEDPRFIARRLVVIASEDVGLARPGVLPIVVAAKDAVEFLGVPEGAMALLEAVVVLAAAPKSNSVAKAWKTLREEVRRTGPLPVPMHLRSAATGTLGKLGWGVGYQYAHDHEGGLVDQTHLPDDLLGRSWYAPGEAGWEPEVARHMARLDAFRAGSREGDAG